MKVFVYRLEANFHQQTGIVLSPLLVVVVALAVQPHTATTIIMEIQILVQVIVVIIVVMVHAPIVDQLYIANNIHHLKVIGVLVIQILLEVFAKIIFLLVNRQYTTRTARTTTTATSKI